MKRPRWRRLALAAVLGATSMTLLVEPSHATPADPPPAAAHRVAKPKPPPPPDAVDLSKGPRVIPKPKRDPAAATPSLGPWSVTLTASDNYPWPTRYTTLTATANQDVGPTPYYISIYDVAGSYIAICGAGTTCTVSVTHPTWWDGRYFAYISTSPMRQPGANPPPDVQASTEDVGRLLVRWRETHVDLSASPSTLPLGSTTTLTATVSRGDWPETMDIGPSPFWLQIFDVATGAKLAECGWGSTCTASVSVDGSGTRNYQAYLADQGSYNSPTGVQAVSTPARVTWTSSTMRVSLDLPRHNMCCTPVTITASTNEDVGPTPYYIEIFHVRGHLVSRCAYGTTCSAEVDRPISVWGSYIAVVSPYSNGVPPAPVANSSVVDAAFTWGGHPVP